ncbi:MAG: hypothetical protein IJZ80_05195 [Clostridia bacterium]|nr:hypothetical protein [Clostridia bacterium]
MAGRNSARDTWRYWDFMSYENARKSEIGLNASHFTMRYSKTYKLVQAHLCLLFLLSGIAFQITSLFHDLFPIAVFCYAGAAFFLINLLYLLSYQCHVTPQKIVQIEFWIFKKEVAWSSIKAKKVKKDTDKDSPLYADRLFTLILYRANHKKAFRFIDKMVGFTYLQKMTKQKQIPTARKHHKNSR